jgi:hypothetical protein
MLTKIKEATPTQKVAAFVVASGLTLSMLFTAVAWAVDARIEQKTSAQMQQLRVDILSDFDKRRMAYLQMKKNAAIINDDERIELEYLQGQNQ